MLERRAAARPVGAIRHQDHPRIKGSRCTRQPRQQAAKQNAEVGDYALACLSACQGVCSQIPASPQAVLSPWIYHRHQDTGNGTFVPSALMFPAMSQAMGKAVRLFMD